jgi:hypothetical protein
MTVKVRSGGRTAPTLPRSGDRAAVRTWPGLFALLLLACLLVQGTLVQSHLHFAGQLNPQAASGEPSAQLSKPAKENPATDCPLCHDAAMAGAYLLPSATVLPPPPAAILWLFAAPMAVFGLPSPALGWLSRAPPQQL